MFIQGTGLWLLLSWRVLLGFGIGKLALEWVPSLTTFRNSLGTEVLSVPPCHSS